MSKRQFHQGDSVRVEMALEDLRAAMEKALRALSCEGEYSHLQNRSSGDQIDCASDVLLVALNEAKGKA